MVVNTIKSFDHVAITVKDFDEIVNWYVKNLGLSVKRIFENKERGIRIAFLEAGGQAVLEFLGFIDPEKAVVGPTLKAEETGIKHVSFFVDDIDETCRSLKKAGVKFSAYTPERAVFKDPNGTIVELRRQ